MDGLGHARLIRRQRPIYADTAVAGPAQATTARPVAAATTPAAPAAAVTTTPARGAAAVTTTPAAAGGRGTRPIYADTASGGVPAASSLATTPSVANTVATRASTTPRAAASSVVASSRSSAVVNSAASSSSPSSSASAAASSSSSTGSKTNGGAIAGAIIAVLVVIGAIVAFVFWRKKRAARAGNAASSSGGNGAWTKQRDDDEFFGQQQQQQQGSPFDDARGEKFGAGGEGAKYGAMAGAVGAAGVGGWAAQHHHQQQQQQQQQQRGQSWGNGPAEHYGQAPSQSSFVQIPRDQPQQQQAFPPVVPSSTTNLLSSYPQQQRDPTHGEIESREMQQHLENQRAQTAALYNPAAPVHSSPPSSPPAPVAAVAPVNPFGQEQVGQGEVRIVRRGFEPSLDDELLLKPGQHIQLLVKYDDDWALGINLDHEGRKGVFPFDCLGPVDSSAATPKLPSPTSSNKPLQTITESSQQQEKEELGYLSYDQPESPPASSTSTSTAPQLPTLRSDSPINFGAAPTIQISDPSGSSNAAAAKRSSATGDYFLGAEGSGKEKAKRTSSLIASRDADLFVALGEVLDRDGAAQQEQQRK